MKFPIYLALAVLVLSGCGTTTGNYGVALLVQATRPGALAALLGYRALQDGSPVTLTATNKNGATGGTLTLTDARLALKEIRFKLSTATAAQAELKYQGPLRRQPPDRRRHSRVADGRPHCRHLHRVRNEAREGRVRPRGRRQTPQPEHLSGGHVLGPDGKQRHGQ